MRVRSVAEARVASISLLGYRLREMWRGVPVVLIAAVSGVVSSCADDPPPLSSVESFCGGVCEGAVRCDNRLSWQTCNNACVSDSGNQALATIRPEAAAVVGDCLSSQLACDMIFNGPFDSCWDRARSETPPSPHLVEFCVGYATSAFECGYWFSVEACQTGLNIRTDEFLDELAACTQLATCEATDACLKTRFGST